MTEPVIEFSEDERKLLRQSKGMRELIDHPGWKELLAIVDAHIKHRQEVVSAPIHLLQNASPGGPQQDFMSRAIQMEHIKGAIYGMRMVCSLPSITIQHATDTVAGKTPRNPKETT